MTDDELKAARDAMTAKRSECRKAHADMGAERYTTPEGQQCMDDIRYYDGIINRIEGEMQYRMMTQT